MTEEMDPSKEDLFDQLKSLSTSAIADTKHDGVTVIAPSVQPVHTACAVVGTARTVQLDAEALWAPVETLDEASEGEVIVVDTDECVDEAVWGELLSTYATATGVTGMVTNGAVRDVAGIREIGFPSFALARTPRGPSGSEEAETNVQVTVGDARIEPGDVIVGDESGVVVIERSAVDEVVPAAENIAEMEREVERLINEGKSLGMAFERAGMIE